jgi:hypothetical protein
MMRAPRKLTPAPARRRDKRFGVDLPAVLHVGRTHEQARTVDVGHGGVFLATSLEVPLRQLVKVQMFLPPEDVAFEAAGKLVHRVDVASASRAAGFGVQFYGLGRDAREVWDRFIAHVRASHPEVAPLSVHLCHAERIEPIYRRNDRHALVLRVRGERLPDMVALYERVVKERRMFVLYQSNAFVDDPVGLQIVHPYTEDIFELEGKVVRVVRDATLSALDISLSGLDEERLERFDEFLYDAIAPMFDDEDIL